MPVRYSARSYQRRMQSFVCATPACALWAEMGLGKTAVSLHAIAGLIAGGESKRVLVIAPKRVAEHTWPSELTKWSGLSWLSWKVLTIKTTVSREKKSGKQVRVFDPPAHLLTDEDIHIVGRENFAYLARWYGKRWPYDTVIVDEACGFKSRTSERFKALRYVRPYINRIIELTGTPGAENYLELWAQIYLLDGGERLGRTITGFRTQYFDSDYMGFKYTLKPGAAEAIHAKISDIALSLRTQDYLELPDRVDHHIDTPLSTAQMKRYKAMEKNYILEIDSEPDIIADTAAILANKLLQLANGTIYRSVFDLDNAETRETIPFHTAKLEALDLLLQQADGPVLIAYSYQADKERILDKFKHVTPLDSAADIDCWNAGRVPAGLLHPASAAGLNLQDGGNLLVWYGLPWSLRQYLQTRARLHRPGQTKPVFNYHLVAPGTYDEKVLDALSDKTTGQDGLLAAMSD